MTQPTGRDELVRHLYVNDPNDPEAGPQLRQAFAVEWDEGLVTDDDRADCYARADAILAGQVA